MASKSQSQRPKGRDGLLSTLDVLIQALSIAGSTCGIPPAQIAISSANALLSMIRDSVSNKEDYVDLGVSCGEVCQTLGRGLKRRRLDELSESVLEAIEQLTTTVAKIHGSVIERGKRNAFSRAFHSKTDKDAIVAWRQDLNRILQIFNTELLMDTHLMVADIHRNVLASQGGSDGQHQSAQASVPPGESPPPPPRVCFGRNELIEKVVGFAKNFEPVALIGAGGIGKTSIALSVLHHNLIEDQFGGSRRFIRCDQFPPSRAHFLAQLSKAIGAGVDNPEDLTPLRPFLSSQKLLIVLDNAESIFDPQLEGTNAQEIYAVADELCRFKTVFVCITSRITTVPQHCKRLVVPTLSAEAACDAFYNIYNDSGRSDIIDDLLQRLDYHALSITLLATTASHNMWDHDELVKEWDTHRAQVLRTDHNYSLAATIELSLTSPTFQKLGADARQLLGVVAFFPQGVDKKNLEWLFPTIPDRKNIFNKFCVLSLAYPSNGYITMLAPVRDYLRPQDPRSSPLLCATKDRYFTRLSVNVDPAQRGFGEAGWIKSEDVNVEHLLDVFISINADASDALDACAHFMEHLHWHKPRQTVLGSRVEGLPEDHPSKAECLYQLSRVFRSLGNYAEQRRLLSQALQLDRKQGNDRRVAETLRLLSDASLMLGLPGEGIQQAEEAMGIYRGLNDIAGQAESLRQLAWLLYDDKQLDAAKEAVTRAIDILPEKGQEFRICQCHQLLGDIYQSKGEKEKAIHHFEVALEIASSSNWKSRLFWIHYSLAQLFHDEDAFDNANSHVEQAKSQTGEDKYLLGRATELQAQIFRKQGRLEDARSEVWDAKAIYEELGSAKDVQDCRDLLQQIEQAERPTSPA